MLVVANIAVKKCVLTVLFILYRFIIALSLSLENHQIRGQAFQQHYLIVLFAYFLY